MQRVLVLGGTGWLGRAITERAVAAGDEVVCLARGRSGSVCPGARFEPADRTAPGAYDALTGEWDDVIELSYAPSLVAPALDALAARARHWTLVSSVSVYARNDEPGAEESAAVVEPTDLSDYGQAKVAAERLSRQRFGERLAIVRPGLIAGPGDPSDRFGYWPARLSRGGDVLVPTLANRWMQVIDVADLAAFIDDASRTGLAGVVNAVGHSVAMASFLDQLVRTTGCTGRLVQAPDEWLLTHGVQYWMGERSLPLWLPVTETGFARRSNAAYLAAGGTVRSLAETIEQVLIDERTRGVDRPRRSGLAATDEQELLRLLP